MIKNIVIHTNAISFSPLSFLFSWKIIVRKHAYQKNLIFLYLFFLSNHSNDFNDQYVKNSSISKITFLLIITKRFVCTSIKCWLAVSMMAARDIVKYRNGVVTTLQFVQNYSQINRRIITMRPCWITDFDLLYPTTPIA